MKKVIEAVAEISTFLTIRTRSAKSAGKNAYRMLISRSANPYVNNGPSMAQAWLAGWDEGAAEDTNRSEVGQAAHKLQRKFARAGTA